MDSLILVCSIYFFFFLPKILSRKTGKNTQNSFGEGQAGAEKETKKI